VFTGVSGSGKSSLGFGMIAAEESQRMINETYSAFVQGFMPTLARPEVDVLEGLTTAIIVDQERMGADARSTVGTATDANAMLRILFSRLGQPHIGSPNAFSFNVPSVRASGAITIERGGDKTVRQTFTRTGGMCPRCEGRGTVSDIDLTQLYDESKSLAEGAITIPGYKVDGWWTVRIFTESGFLDPNKPIRDYTETELHDFLHREPTKVKVNGVHLTYEGLIPRVQKSFLSKDREALQPHIRAFVDRAVTFTACPECGGTRLNEVARSSRIGGINIADACAMQISDLAEWVRGVDEPSVAPLLATLQRTLDSFVEIGLGYLSLDRPSGTLSGGEAQRVKILHLGSSLTDVTYVFDEPTTGLHPHDIQRMNDLLLRLRDKGNTVLVVEHEPETIAIAEHVVDLDPGAGTAGGTVCFEGTVEGLRASGTLTGRHLDDRAAFKETVRTPTGTLAIGDDLNEELIGEIVATSEQPPPMILVRTLHAGDVFRVALVRPGIDACLQCLDDYQTEQHPNWIPVPAADLPDVYDAGCATPARPGTGLTCQQAALFAAARALEVLEDRTDENNHWLWVERPVPNADVRLRTPTMLYQARFESRPGCPICGV
jgi:excinuclease UvrABC ATPase subunit